MRTCWWISSLSETGSGLCPAAASLIPLPMARSSGGRLPGRPAGRALHQPEECAISVSTRFGTPPSAPERCLELESFGGHASGACVYNVDWREPVFVDRGPQPIHCLRESATHLHQGTEVIQERRIITNVEESTALTHPELMVRVIRCEVSNTVDEVFGKI